jgi:hypothetical protein
MFVVVQSSNMSTIELKNVIMKLISNVRQETFKSDNPMALTARIVMDEFLEFRKKEKELQEKEKRDLIKSFAFNSCVD